MLHEVNKSLKGELKGAHPHTIWVRDDLWEAVIQFKLRNKVSLRSAVEQALVRFLEVENAPKEKSKELSDAEKWGNE